MALAAILLVAGGLLLVRSDGTLASTYAALRFAAALCFLYSLFLVFQSAAAPEYNTGVETQRPLRSGGTHE